MATTFNVLDLIFFAFTVIFVATAFFRGFIKEIFALCGWLISFLASYFLAPLISNLIASHFSNKLILDLVMQIAVFVVVFITFTMTTAGLRDELKGKIPTSFDKSLGILYGLIKTLIIFGLIYSLAINVVLIAGNKKMTKNSYPKWFKEAKCHNLIRISGEALNFPVKKLLSIFAGNLEKKTKNFETDLGKKIDEINKESEEPIKGSNNEYLDQKLEESGYKGYSKKDLEKMNHLIEIIDKK